MSQCGSAWLPTTESTVILSGSGTSKARGVPIRLSRTMPHNWSQQGWASRARRFQNNFFPVRGNPEFLDRHTLAIAGQARITVCWLGDDIYRMKPLRRRHNRVIALGAFGMADQSRNVPYWVFSR
jgi:hypothetical protein